MRQLLTLTALAFLAAPLPAAPLPAAKTGLSQIPAAAPMVVHLRGLEGSVDRIIAYLKNALPDQADAAGLFIRNFSEGAGGRDFTGLVKDGPHFAAFLEMPKEGMEGLPKAAMFLATTDSKKFLDGFMKEAEKKALKKEEGGFQSTVVADSGEPMFILERPGYVILTPIKDVAKQLAQKGVGIDTKISDELLEKYLALDLSVYLSMDLLNKDYAEQLKQMKKLALEELSNNITAGTIEKGQGEVLTKLLHAGFQAGEDSKGFIAGLEFKPTGIALHAQSELRAGTPSSKALAELKQSKFEDIGRLPAGNMFYFGGELNAGLLNALKGVLYGQGVDPDSKEGKAIAAAVEALMKTKPTTQVTSSTAPIAGISTWKAEDAAGLYAAQMKVFEALTAGGNFGGMILKEKPTIKANAQKYKNVSFTQIKLVIDLEKFSAALGENQGLPEEFRKAMSNGMKKLIGESAEVYLGIDGKQTVQVTAKDWDAAKKLLEAYYEGKGTVRTLAGYGQIRKDLPTSGNLLVLVDVPAYLTVIVELLKPAAQGMLPFPLPPKYPAAAPAGSAGYLGMALTLGKDRGSADAVISAECVRLIYKQFVAPFFGVQ